MNKMKFNLPNPVLGSIALGEVDNVEYNLGMIHYSIYFDLDELQ
jgi:hypothetical protein